MSIDTRYNVTPQFVVGICLVLFGTLLTLDRMELIDASTSLQLWPVILIAFGAWKVIEHKESGRTLPGSRRRGSDADAPPWRSPRARTARSRRARG